MQPRGKESLWRFPRASRSTASFAIGFGKQLNGTIGTVILTFLGQHTRFENFAAPERAWQPRSS